MSALRLAGAVLLVCSGWYAGVAVSSGLKAHEEALRGTLGLLRRIRQEISCRRAELGEIYVQLCREGLLPKVGAGAFNALAAPPQLTAQEAECFLECMGGLGRAGAEQECERLGYYAARFEEFLREAERQTQAKAALSRKLCTATGAVLALLLV